LSAPGAADRRPDTGTHLSRYGLRLAQDLPVSLHGRPLRIQQWHA